MSNSNATAKDAITFSVARKAFQRLQDELHRTMSDPATDDGAVQLCLNAYNAANTELQRLLATQIGDLGKTYAIDKDSAQQLTESLTALKKTLDRIKKTAADIQWVLDAVTDFLKFVVLFVK